MTFEKHNPLRKECFTDESPSKLCRKESTEIGATQSLIAMNEVFTSTNFSRINLDKHQLLLKQMVFISTTGWDHLSANPNEEHASSHIRNLNEGMGVQWREHQDF